MSSAESLFKSFIVMLVCLICSVIITNFILMPTEMIQKSMQKTGIEDVPPVWQSADKVDSMVSIGYFLTYFLDFFGVGQFIWTCVRKQRYDIYGNPIEEVN